MKELKLVVTLDGVPVRNQHLGILAFKDASLAKSKTPPPQAGVWTLTAPDGRTWTANSPLEVCGREQKERIPANVALARILEEMDRGVVLSIKRQELWDWAQELRAVLEWEKDRMGAVSVGVVKSVIERLEAHD